jgi:hypothetical protein
MVSVVAGVVEILEMVFTLLAVMAVVGMAHL